MNSAFLQEVYDYIFGHNISNFSDFLKNGTRALSTVNLSNFVSVKDPMIEYPDVPSFDLPFTMKLPIDWGFIFAIAGGIDVVLFVYRWYRTIGIMAKIIRGKNVQVPLKYLTVRSDQVRCCQGKSVVDKCLSMIMLSVLRKTCLLWQTAEKLA